MLSYMQGSPRPSSANMSSYSENEIAEIRKQEIRKELEEFVEDIKCRKMVIDTEEGQVDVKLPPDLELITKSVCGDIF